MKYYKLNQGNAKIFKIEKEIFEKTTKTINPYYDYIENCQYAVCPACDNPIKILGLYKKLKDTDKPYGKHYPKSINGIAVYNQQAYEFCPYRAKQVDVNHQSRRRTLTDFEKNIYNLLKEYFDTAIYILSKELDIKITNKVARNLLERYVRTKGYLYDYSSINNIPYIIGYLYPALNLYGQSILKDSPLYKAIKESCPEVEFIKLDKLKNYEILKIKKGKFLEISYCIIHHRRKIEDDICIETVKLLVSTGNVIKGNSKDIYSKTIKIQENYFLNLINNSKVDGYRNKDLIEIANEVMPEL